MCGGEKTGNWISLSFFFFLLHFFILIKIGFWFIIHFTLYQCVYNKQSSTACMHYTQYTHALSVFGCHGWGKSIKRDKEQAKEVPIIWLRILHRWVRSLLQLIMLFTKVMAAVLWGTDSADFRSFTTKLNLWYWFVCRCKDIRDTF